MGGCPICNCRSALLCNEVVQGKMGRVQTCKSNRGMQLEMLCLQRVLEV